MVKRVIHRGKKNRRNKLYSIITPSNGLTVKVFLKSADAYMELKAMRDLGVFGKHKGRVVPVLILDNNKDLELYHKKKQVKK
jgi:hypothetical protein